jgi:thioredoxin 1
MSTLELTKENFEPTIEAHDIVLIDFWAEWCAPCRAFKPIYEKAAEDHPEIAFASCNTEEQMELAGAFQIRSIPTLMAFRDKILLYAQPGMLPAEALEDLISQIKALDMGKVRSEITAQEQNKAVATS